MRRDNADHCIKCRKVRGRVTVAVAQTNASVD